MFITDAFAQTADAATQQGSIYGTVIQLALIFIIFYVLLIRPQQKKIKQHEAILNSIKKGDKVITGGGIYAKVINADDPTEITVEIASGLEVKVNRGTIRDVVNPEAAANAAKIAVAKASKSKPANSNKKAKK